MTGATREEPPAAPSDENKIAIVGMAARVPGAGTLDEFWQMLVAGRTPVRRFSFDELEEFPSSDEHDALEFVPSGFVLDDADLFDAEFFGYSPAEAARTDPQQRVFLEVCWHALEDAAISPDKTRAVIGVYGAANHSAYCSHRLPPVPITALEAHIESSYASDKDYMTSRAAFKMNLTGPAVTIQTGCSSSLTAAAIAVTDLLTWGCDVALVGGAAIHSPRKFGYLRRASGWLSRDGISRPFDAQSSGMVVGTGVGAVVLKRLGDARRDRDRIYAVISGSGVANDGSEKVQFGAPSMKGQIRAIRMAMAMARIERADVGMVETHAMGTPIGDAVEVAALRRAYGAPAASEHCYLGALKANIGQTAAAGGVLGLIKAALCLEREVIAPHPTFTTPHPENMLDGSGFDINTAPEPWPRGHAKRHAGVSSFAAGGTNVHLVLEEAPEPDRAERAATLSAPILLPLSAKRPHALQRAKAALAAMLRSGEVAPVDAAHTLIAGRTDFGVRAAVAAHDGAEAAGRLATASAVPVPAYPRLAFVLSESGDGDYAAAACLYEGFAAFRAAADRIAAAARVRFDFDPAAPLRGASPVPTTEAHQALTRMAFAYATAELLATFAVKPQAIVGQGALDPLAAALAGIFSVETALRVAGEPRSLSRPSSPALREWLRQEHLQRPRVNWLRDGSSGFIPPAEATDPDLWIRTAPTDAGAWQRNGRALVAWGATVIVDIGARGLASSEEDEDAAHAPALFLVSPHGDCRDTQDLFGLLAALWCHGVADAAPEAVLAAADPGRHARPASLPVYSFARERHWLDVDPRSAGNPAQVSMHIATTARESQWLSSPVWTEAVAAGARDSMAAAVIGGDPGGLAGELSARLDVPHLTGEPRAALALARQLDQAPPGASVWCMWPEHAADQADRPAVALNKALSCRDGLADLARVIASTGRPRRLIVVTRGLASVRGDEWMAPEYALVLGPARSQPHETPLLSCQVVDVDSSCERGATAAQLAGLVGAARHDRAPVEFTALRDARLWTRELRQAGLVPDEAELPPQGRYIVLGADQPAGRAIARSLAGRSTAAAIGLIVRPSPERTPERAAFVSELRTRYGARAMTVEADLTMPGAADAMRALALRLGGVDGVIHAADGPAGNARTAILNGPSTGTVGPKVLAIAAIEEAFGDTPLDFLALCSSAEAQWGAAGRSDAIASNAFLDHYAASSRLPRCRRKLSIGWDHWRECAEAPAEGAPRAQPQTEARTHGLTEPQGGQWFLRCLESGLQTPIVRPLAQQNLATLLRQRADEAHKRYAAQSGVNIGPAYAGAGKPRPRLDTAYQAPDRPMERLLAMLWSENLGYKTIGIHDRFVDLGGDETAAFDLLWKISRCTGFDMPIDVFHELQTIERCAEYLWEKELVELRKLRLEVEDAVGK